MKPSHQPHNTRPRGTHRSRRESGRGARRPSRPGYRTSAHRARALAIGASILLILAAFFSGLTWKKWMTKPTASATQAAAQVDTAQQQTEGLRLMDEAVKAKHEERYDDALRAVADARRADPGIRGVDTISAEIALRRHDPEGVRTASRAAIRRGENEADAKLLLAIDAWMSRGQPDKAVQFGQVATQFLEEASMDDISNGEVRSFLGDVQRLLGESLLASHSIVAGAVRLPPWSSSLLILAKMQLAADEAGNTPNPIEMLSTAGYRAVRGLRAALRPGQDPQALLDEVASCFTASQTRTLLADVSFVDLSEPSRKKVLDSISKPLPGAEPPESETRKSTSF